MDRPIKTAEIRVKNLECSITKQEVCEAVAAKAECHVQEIQIGSFQHTMRGQNSLWMRIPLVVARKITRDGYINVG